MRGVAQLVSAPRSGRGGRWFESSHLDKTEAIDRYRLIASFIYIKILGN